MIRLTSILRVAVLTWAVSAIPAFAQSAADFQVLEQQIKVLQAKVTKLQEEQADSTVNYSGTAATAAAAAAIEESKVKLSAGVTELKLYGDLRFRYQYDQLHPQVDTTSNFTDDRNRYRFRLRIGADVQLGDQFFAGIVLASGQPADSNNQTFTEGYDNYSIYIDKAFAGWAPTDWFTVVLGKQANPLYTTDLVWDPNITPQGAVETLDLSKAFLPEDSRLSLQLISLQGIFENGSSFSTGADTAWQFAEQLKGTWHFNKDTSVTFAPGFLAYTAASLSGLQNSQPFTKSSDALAAPNGVQTQTTTTTTETNTIKYAPGTGAGTLTVTPVNTTTTVTITDPSTGATRKVTTQTTNNQTQITTTIPTNKALAGQTFVTTKTVGGGTTTVTSPVGQTPARETADLALITAPGDISFKLGGIATKVYWDFAYNTVGDKRAANEYFLTSHSAQDDFAWLAGIQIGNNVHAGDWSFNANYRQVGMDSIDPNLNDSNWGLSYVNLQGIKVGVAYSFTDSFVGAITYYGAWTLRHGITGGEATGGSQLANAKSANVLQVDLNLKF